MLIQIEVFGNLDWGSDPLFHKNRKNAVVQNDINGKKDGDE